MSNDALVFIVIYIPLDFCSTKSSSCHISLCSAGKYGLCSVTSRVLGSKSVVYSATSLKHCSMRVLCVSFRSNVNTAHHACSIRHTTPYWTSHSHHPLFSSTHTSHHITYVPRHQTTSTTSYRISLKRTLSLHPHHALYRTHSPLSCNMPPVPPTP